MPYQDTWAVCTQCGRRFIFRVEDQRRQSELGEPITPPQLCPSCQKETRRQGETEQSERTEVAASTQPPGLRGQAPDTGSYEGVVKWFNGEKGYGFIAQRNADDIFFHRTGFSMVEGGEIEEDTPVRYRIEHTEKGPQAVDIERLGNPEE